MYLNEKILLTDKGKIMMLKACIFIALLNLYNVYTKGRAWKFFWRGSIFLLPHISNVFISHYNYFGNNFIVLEKSIIDNGLYK
jgi:hypothetical protein